MSGVTASVLLRSPFMPSDTGRVTQLLRAIANDVSEARKGRHWDFTVSNTVASLTVFATSQHASDFEDDLLANDLLFDDAPDALVISFPTSRDCDRDLCGLLSEKLAETLGGINCGFADG